MISQPFELDIQLVDIQTSDVDGGVSIPDQHVNMGFSEYQT